MLFMRCGPFDDLNSWYRLCVFYLNLSILFRIYLNAPFWNDFVFQNCVNNKFELKRSTNTLLLLNLLDLTFLVILISLKIYSCCILTSMFGRKINCIAVTIVMTMLFKSIVETIFAIIIFIWHVFVTFSACSKNGVLCLEPTW